MPRSTSLCRVYTDSSLPEGAQQSTAEVELELMELWSSVEKDKAAARERNQAARQKRMRAKADAVHPPSRPLFLRKKLTDGSPPPPAFTFIGLYWTDGVDGAVPDTLLLAIVMGRCSIQGSWFKPYLVRNPTLCVTLAVRYFYGKGHFSRLSPFEVVHVRIWLAPRPVQSFEEPWLPSSFRTWGP